MTKAQAMQDRWINDLNPIESPEVLAKELDPRVRVEGFLYSKRQRFIFPDGSVSLFVMGTLMIAPPRR